MGGALGAKIVLGIAQNLFNGGMAQDSIRLKQKGLDIQTAQFGLDLLNQYTSYLSTLTDLKGTFNTTYLSGLQNQANIASSQAWLDRHQGYYQYNMAQMNQQGIGQYQQLMQNWQNQQVISAERGQSGNTVRLLAEMQKQNLANMYGSELTYNMDNGLLGMAMREARLDMEAEKQTVENNLNVLKQTDTINLDTLSDIGESIIGTGASIAAFGDVVGVDESAVNAVADDIVDFMTGEGGANAKYGLLEGGGGILTDTTAITDIMGAKVINPIAEGNTEIDANGSEDGHWNEAEIVEQIEEKRAEDKLPTDLDYRVVGEGYTYDKGDENSNLSGTAYKIQVKDADGNYRDATDKEIEALNKTYANSLAEIEAGKGLDYNLPYSYDALSGGGTKGLNKDTTELVNLYALAGNEVEITPEEVVKQNKVEAMAQEIVDQLSGQKFLDKDDKEDLQWAQQQLKIAEQQKQEAAAKAAEEAKLAQMSEKEKKKKQKQQTLTRLANRETEK